MLQSNIGMRTIKTGIAVTLSVVISELLQSQYPIFIVIAAIVSMNRTITGSFESARDLLIGNAFGAITGLLFAVIFPQNRAVLMGIGIIVIILFCNKLNISNATPLSCIVFSSICLNMGSSDPMLYSIHRLADTFLGLMIAILINVVFKPYNNLPKIRKITHAIQKTFPPLIEARVLCSRIPDLHLLLRDLKKLDNEISLYENEWIGRKKRRSEAAHLRGCEQLLTKMADELSSLCQMDSTPVPTAANLARLQALGLTVPEDDMPDCKCSAEDNTVLNFHLKNLLDANDFLTELLPL